MRAGICDPNSPQEKGWPQAGVFRMVDWLQKFQGLQVSHSDETPKVGGDDREDLQWISRCLHLYQAGRVIRDHICNLSEQHLFPLVPVLAVGCHCGCKLVMCRERRMDQQR